MCYLLLLVLSVPSSTQSEHNSTTLGACNTSIKARLQLDNSATPDYLFNTMFKQE